MSLNHVLEALIIAGDEPLSLARLRDLTEASSSDIREALIDLQSHYDGRGIRLVEAAGGWQFRSNPEHAAQVQQLWQTRPPKLSRSMLETLAIIAYRQPVTRAEIEVLRGIKVSSSIVGGLQERGWIKVLGRKEVPGRPHLYGTGKQFLVDFGLKSLSDLPEIAQLMDEEEVEENLLEQARLDEQGPDDEDHADDAAAPSVPDVDSNSEAANDAEEAWHSDDDGQNETQQTESG